MQVIINPGSGPVEESTLDQAAENMREFVKAVGNDVKFVRSNPQEDSDGRFAFQVRNADGSKWSEVDMPGCELEEVRNFFRRAPHGCPGPRLYVD